MNSDSISKPYTSTQVTSWTRITVGAAAGTFVMGITLFFLTAPGVAQCSSFGAFMGATTAFLGMTLYARLKHCKESHQFAKIIAVTSVIAMIGVEIALINQLAGSRNLYCTLTGVAITVLALPVMCTNYIRSRDHDTQARQERLNEMLLKIVEKNDGRRAEELLKAPAMRKEIPDYANDPEEAALILNLTPQERAYAQRVIAKNSGLSQLFGLAAFLRTGVVDSTYEQHPLIEELQSFYEQHPLIEELQSFKGAVERGTHPRIATLSSAEKAIICQETTLLWTLCICGEYALAKKAFDALQQTDFPPGERAAILATVQNIPRGWLEVLAPKLYLKSYSSSRAEEIIKFIRREAKDASPEFAEDLLRLAGSYLLYPNDGVIKDLLMRSLQRNLTPQQRLEMLNKYSLYAADVKKFLEETLLKLPKDQFVAFIGEGNAGKLISLLQQHDIFPHWEIRTSLMTLFFEEVEREGGSLEERIERVLEKYSYNWLVISSLPDYIRKNVPTQKEAQAILRLLINYKIKDLDSLVLREPILLATSGQNQTNRLYDLLRLHSYFPHVINELIEAFIKEHQDQVVAVLMGCPEWQTLLASFSSKILTQLLPLAIKSQNEEFREGVVLAIVTSSDIELQKNLVRHVYGLQANSLKKLLAIYLQTFLDAYLTFNFVDPAPVLQLLKSKRNQLQAILQTLSEKSLNTLLLFVINKEDVIFNDIIVFMTKNKIAISRNVELAVMGLL